MLVFAAHWAWWCLPLPLLVQAIWAAFSRRRIAVRAPMITTLTTLTGNRPGEGTQVWRRNRLQSLVLVVCWCLFVISLARPQWLGEPITQTKAARDIMIAVDLSASMEAEDFGSSSPLDTTGQPLDRLSGVKQVLTAFVQNREHDRLGLIVFGSAPYLQVPFSLDKALFLYLLTETRTRMAGPKTMLGDAIGLAVTHFEKHESQKRVLLLLTDGNDSGSRVPPLEAAKVAADHRVTIHTIAIGSPETVGEQALDVQSLQAVSQTTGGVFFHAYSRQELSDIYAELERLEPSEQEVVSYRPRQELYFWPLGMALVLQLLLHYCLFLTRWWREQQLPRGGTDG